MALGWVKNIWSGSANKFHQPVDILALHRILPSEALCTMGSFSRHVWTIFSDATNTAAMQDDGGDGVDVCAFHKHLTTIDECKQLLLC